MSRIAVNTALKYASGASWDPYAVCLEATRTGLRTEIDAWIRAPSPTNTAVIFLLSAGAGVGKTALAHTIAQRCATEKILLSSFFFHRDTAERNTPDTLISTIAIDMCKIHQTIQRRIEAALEDDRSLASPPISRQFDRLLVDSSHIR